jgi:hypothetical protein
MFTVFVAHTCIAMRAAHSLQMLSNAILVVVLPKETHKTTNKVVLFCLVCRYISLTARQSEKRPSWPPRDEAAQARVTRGTAHSEHAGTSM